MDQDTGKWVHLGYLPYEVLHKKWQWYLLEMVRRQIDTEEVEHLVDYCYKKYPDGFVANGEKRGMCRTVMRVYMKVFK